jgi:hypothetical protein
VFIVGGGGMEIYRGGGIYDQVKKEEDTITTKT